MASVLKLFHDFLYKLRFTRGFVHRFFRRWALFFAFLGRKLSVWRLWDDKRRGTFPRVEQAQRSSPCTGTDLDFREYVVAASYVPASATRSASNPASLHYVSSATQQPQPATVSGTPLALSVESPSHRDHVNPSSVSDARIDPGRRSSDSSVRRRSSDGLSTHSRVSSMSVGHVTRFPRAPHRQFGRGPSLEIDVITPHPQTQVDRGNSPISPLSVTSHGHTQPSIHGLRRRKSSASVVVGVVNPSTDSLPNKFFTDGPLTEEPYTIGSPTGHLPVPDIDVDERFEGLPQYNLTNSSTSNFDPPFGRSLRLITSEQVPRYTKDVTVQVDNTITTGKRLRLLADPAKAHTTKSRL